MNAAAPPPQRPADEIEARLRAIDSALISLSEQRRTGSTPTKGFNPEHVKRTRATLQRIAEEGRKQNGVVA